MKKTVSVLLMFIIATGLTGCHSGSSSSHKTPSPAEVKNPVPENQLTTITLTAQAEKRLGIKTTTIQSQNISKSLTQHGEVLAIPGFTVAVTAPFTGKLTGNTLVAGRTVHKGQTIFSLVALPNDTSGLGAQQEVTVRQKQLDAAQAQVNRYQQLVQDQSISQRLLQESQVALQNAQAALNSAQSRERFLNGYITRSDASRLSVMGIKAPLTGMVQKIYVTPNQVVSGGTPLFEVSSLNPVWVRVPVYAGDLSSVSSSQTALVQPLGENAGSGSRVARFVPGPPTANPQAISTDLFYELSNSDNAFQVGQKVSVTLTQKGSQSGLTIPFSAVVYDIDGGTWIYRQVAPHTYARKRVLVSRVMGDKAILAHGIEPESKIVYSGAAELFGTEFGAGK